MVLFTGELRSARFGQSTLPAVGSRRTAALSLAELGNFVEGRSMGEDAVRIAEAAEQPFSIAMALMTVGVVYYRLGDIHTVVPVLERGLVLCQTANFPRLVPLTASFLGAAYALTGRIAEACPILDQTLKRVATGSSMLFHTLVLTGLSEALFFVGRMDEAGALAERLLNLFHTHIGRGYQAHACRLLGEIAAHRHPPEVEKAQAHYCQALTLAQELVMRPLLAHCHRGLGMLYAQRGLREQTHTELSAAITMYRSMDMTFWLRQMGATLAQEEAR
jgi:tetratricopeptide (TPR) repeat protein